MNTARISHEAGFTMVEILTALTILGLMASVVVLTLPDGDRAFRNEVGQLAARLEMAAQESVITGRPLGFAISNEGYSFQHLRNGTWQAVTGDRIFVSHHWSEATNVSIERSAFFQPSDDEETPEPRGESPLLSFDPTGLPVRYTLRLERNESLYVLQSDGRMVEVSDARL